MVKCPGRQLNLKPIGLAPNNSRARRAAHASRRVAAAAQNQPCAHATHATMAAQFTVCACHPRVPVRFPGGNLRSDNGASAPPEGDRGILGGPGLRLSHRLHRLGDRWALACRAIDDYRRNRSGRRPSQGDLQRIARSANDELKIIRRKGMSDPLRQAQATRLIEQARDRAVRRVESTLRQRCPHQSSATRQGRRQ
jgi:hypothetical protein